LVTKTYKEQQLPETGNLLGTPETFFLLQPKVHRNLREVNTQRVTSDWNDQSSSAVLALCRFISTK
jgi:hypothetical protein